jgi:4-hydroxybenzoate polyprenyltransferase
MLPPSFAVALLIYVVSSILYSAWLKRVAMLDVVLLACFYTLRVLAGGLATGIAVTEWLMAFSLFIFVSLAFAKRYTELARLTEGRSDTLTRRDYRRDDLSLLEVLGPASGLVAVLVLALYIQSEQMLRLYSHPWALWILCPLLLYWISRVWIKAKRQELHDDPVVFAIRDPVSLVVALLAGGLLLIAAIGKS